MVPTAKLMIKPYHEDNTLVDTIVGSVGSSLSNLGFGEGFTVQVNPETINFSHTISYKQDQPSGDMGGDLDFDVVKPVTLEFEVLFDRTGAIQTGDVLGNEIALLSGQGVDLDINALKKVVLKYDGEIHRPKKVKILWGKSMQMLGQLTFRGQLANLSYSYKRFNSFGIPLRASVSLTFQGVLEDQLRAKIKNNNSPDITRQLTVKEGDTLPLLSYKVYGDSKYYMAVMKANGLVHFRDLQPGQQLVFPPIE